MKSRMKTGSFWLAAAALLCALPSSLIAVEQSPVLPTTAQGWSELARQDIEAAYQITAENHPGMADKHNPDFQQQLLQAKTNALLLVTQVTDAYGYEAAIDRFSTSLQDGHAGAYARLPDSVPSIRHWPGFNTVWRGDALWVYYSEQDGVTAGMQVLSCDGKTVESLIKNRVFSFAGQADLPGHWWSYGSRLLLDDGNPFNPRLKQCQLVKPGTEAVAITLNWQPRPESAMQHVKDAYNGDKLPVGLSWQQKDVAWIAMPTFSPEADDIKLYESLFSSLEQQRSALLQAKAIVLDLRHNQGGSSYWSVQVASALWGKKRVESLRTALFSKTEVWWFASPGNTDYVKSLYDVLKTQGQTDMLPWIQAVGLGMQKSLDSGKAFYVEGKDSEADAASIQPETRQELPPLQVPVYVIVPGQCASACLDALDVFTLFENTKLAGAPSSADSTYMDVRFQILPSGLGQVIIPNKVYVNRPRANGQYYTPALAHNELDWSTQSLLQKVLSDIKN